MASLIGSLFTSDFMPHGHCFYWRPDVLWLNVGADLLIALSYYSIPLLLLGLLRQAPNLLSHRIVLLFASFIFLCGTTHLIAIWTIWNPDYHLEGGVKLLTGMVSAATAFLLWRMMPRITQMPSMQALLQEVGERQKAQRRLEDLRGDLERRVHERTSELSSANESLSRLATIVDATADAIFVVSIEGRILSWNRSAARIFGHDYHEVIGKQIHEVSLSDDEEWSRAHADALKGEDIINREIKLSTPNGQSLWLSVSVSKLSNVPGAQAVAFIVRDVTERFQHEELFRMTVESAPHAMILVDHHGRIVLANEQTQQIFGYSHQELLNMQVEELIPERHRQHHSSYRNSFMAYPEKRPMGKGRELFGVRKDGSEVPLEIGLTPIQSRQGLMVIASLTDITDYKQAQDRLQASLAEKELLLREVYHRVKNNLQVVSSLLKLQAGYLQDAKMQSLLLESEERIRAIALVHERLYRSETLSKVNLKSYVDELTKGLVQSHSVTGAAIELVVDVEDVELTIEKAIPCGLILNELISNCLKHAFVGRSQGRIEIEFVQRNSEITLRVHDNGKGMPRGLTLESPATLGLKVITTLSLQLGARLDLINDDGTTFEVTFNNSSNPITPRRETNGNNSNHAMRR